MRGIAAAYPMCTVPSMKETLTDPFVIMHKRVKQYVSLVEHANPCIHCRWVFTMGESFKSYAVYTPEEKTWSLGGYQWEVLSTLDADVLRIQQKPRRHCEHGRQTSIKYMPAYHEPTWKLEKYRELRYSGLSIDGATQVLRHLPPENWIYSEHAWHSTQLMINLRQRGGLDPAIPHEWLDAMDWLVQHSIEIDPRELAVMIWEAKVGSPPSAPRVE